MALLERAIEEKKGDKFMTSPPLTKTPSEKWTVICIGHTYLPLNLNYGIRNSQGKEELLNHLMLIPLYYIPIKYFPGLCMIFPITGNYDLEDRAFKNDHNFKETGNNPSSRPHPPLQTFGGAITKVTTIVNFLLGLLLSLSPYLSGHRWYFFLCDLH